MSRSTPRRSRHRHQLSGGGPNVVAVSGYDSDLVHYFAEASSAPPPQLSAATDPDLNRVVLARYIPNLCRVVSIAANAVVYDFLGAEGGWDKSNVQGPLFVCEQEPLRTAAGITDGTVLPQACVFVLNRRSLENFCVDLTRVADCEVAGELLILKVVDEVQQPPVEDQQQQQSVIEGKIYGIWIHADTQDTRVVNNEAIRAAWLTSREAMVSVMNATGSAGAADSAVPGLAPLPETDGQGAPLIGRQISITDILGQISTNGRGVQ